MLCHRPGRAGAAAVIVLVAAGLCVGAAPPPAADHAIPVSVQVAGRQDLPVYATGLGTVSPLNSALVRARVDGTLDSVAFTEGQEVKAGDLLAIIDPRPYLAVLDQARARRLQDLATLGNAKRDLSRYTTLADQGFGTRQSADTQSATVDSGHAGIEQDDAAIEAAALNVAYSHVTAPISGRVGLRLTNPGNLVHATDSQGIVMITQLHPIGVLFTLPEESVPAIADAQRAGTPQVQAVQNPADADPGGVSGDDSDRNAPRVLGTGTLLTTDNAIDTGTGTIQLKAVFANAENRLWPGEFVQARLKLRTLPQVVTVPARAVQRGQDGLFVFVVGADDAIEQRPVTEYQEQDGIAAIRSGLQGGEHVVVDGESRVSAGAKVNPRMAAG